MRKLLLSFGLALFSAVGYGQIKQIKLSDKDVNDLAFRLHERFMGLNSSDLKVLNLKNTVGYLVQFEYDNKTIAQKIIPTFPYLTKYGYSYDIEKHTNICFNMNDINNDIAFSLMKEKWTHLKTNENDEFMCSGERVSYFKTEDGKTYKMNSLLDGKITMTLYRLEK